jgi:hypothetical protein
MPSNQQIVNEAILQGRSAVGAAKAVITHDRPDKTIGMMKSNGSIIEENRINFGKVEEDKLLPYKVIVAAMKATKIITRKAWNDKTSSYIEYEQEVPDHQTRLAANRQYTILTGMEPPKPSIHLNTGNVNILNGDVYAEIANLPDEASQIAAYNRIKNMEQRGEIASKIPDDVIDADFDVPEE